MPFEGAPKPSPESVEKPQPSSTMSVESGELLSGPDTEGKPMSSEVLDNPNYTPEDRTGWAWGRLIPPNPRLHSAGPSDYEEAVKINVEDRNFDERQAMINEGDIEPSTERPSTLRSSELAQPVSVQPEKPLSHDQESGVRSKTADEIIAQHGTDVEPAPPTLRSEDVVAAMRRANGVDDTKAA